MKKTPIKKYIIPVRTSVPSPFMELILQDAPVSKGNRVKTKAREELSAHFNDLYHLFLYQYARLTHDASFSKQDEQKLQALLKEIIEIKSKI